MRVLVGCEYSRTVGSAFEAVGHTVLTCDLEPCEQGGRHYQGDVFEALSKDVWDLIILHPPCTHMAVCGNRHYAGTEARSAAVVWTLDLWLKALATGAKVALENPVGVLSSKWRPPDQYIQPWQFGHGETKKTGLWLHNLPPLKPTNIVDGREPRIWKMSPSPDRGKERSRFYPGIAAAMAQQWSI